MEFYILLDEKEFGPFSRAEIFALLKEGRFDLQIPARSAEDQEWRVLAEVLKSGPFALFSAEKLHQLQTEEAPPLEVPDASPIPLEPLQPEPPLPQRGLNLPLIIGSAIFAGLALGALFLVVRNSFDRGNELPRQQISANSQGKVTPAIETPAATPVPPAVEEVSAAKDDPPLLEVPPFTLASSTNAQVSGGEAGGNNSPSAFTRSTTKIDLPGTQQIPDSEMWVASVVGRPKAVLILSIDGQDKGDSVVADHTWLEFARKNDLVLVVCRCLQPIRKRAQRNDIFIKTENGLGDAIAGGLKRTGIDKLPRLIYGWGRGGPFAASLASFSQKQVIAWATYAANFDTTEKYTAKVPALVVCNYEQTRFASSALQLFETARKSGLPWSWLTPSGPVKERLPKVTDFVRLYFAAVLTRKATDGCWAHIRDVEQAFYDDRAGAPETIGWLPTAGLLANWTAIMPPKYIRTDPQVFGIVVHPNVPKQAVFEMFVRFPPNTPKDHHFDGTLAICAVSEYASDTHRTLLYRPDVKDWVGGRNSITRFIDYAEKHNLAVVMWPFLEKYDDERFNSKTVAAWKTGMDFFHKKYGIPDNDLLLYGLSRSGVWTSYLALHNPEKVLAAYVHIPTTLDLPTANAKNVLWLVTSGELDYGYQKAVDFYVKGRDLGYPIFFKAICGLRHEENFMAEAVGHAFFDYALSIRGSRAKALSERNSELVKFKKEVPEWLRSYQQPPYLGDFLNQEMFPISQADMVPVGLRVPLPTQDLATAWAKSHF